MCKGCHGAYGRRFSHLDQGVHSKTRLHTKVTAGPHMPLLWHLSVPRPFSEIFDRELRSTTELARPQQARRAPSCCGECSQEWRKSLKVAPSYARPRARHDRALRALRQNAGEPCALEELLKMVHQPAPLVAPLHPSSWGLGPTPTRLWMPLASYLKAVLSIGSSLTKAHPKVVGVCTDKGKASTSATTPCGSKGGRGEKGPPPKCQNWSQSGAQPSSPPPLRWTVSSFPKFKPWAQALDLYQGCGGPKLSRLQPLFDLCSVLSA